MKWVLFIVSLGVGVTVFLLLVTHTIPVVIVDWHLFG
jgi:hypothetical protein